MPLSHYSILLAQYHELLMSTEHNTKNKIWNPAFTLSEHERTKQQLAKTNNNNASLPSLHDNPLGLLAMTMVPKPDFLRFPLPLGHPPVVPFGLTQVSYRQPSSTLIAGGLLVCSS